MEPGFIFRGQHCAYGYKWVSDEEFHFFFNRMDGGDFIDCDGDAYFIHCQHYQDGNDPIWNLERWYEYESLDATDACFPDRLTETECKSIKEFMTTLMERRT